MCRRLKYIRRIISSVEGRVSGEGNCQLSFVIVRFSFGQEANRVPDTESHHSTLDTGHRHPTLDTGASFAYPQA